MCVLVQTRHARAHTHARARAHQVPFEVTLDRSLERTVLQEKEEKVEVRHNQIREKDKEVRSIYIYIYIYYVYIYIHTYIICLYLHITASMGSRAHTRCTERDAAPPFLFPLPPLSSLCLPPSLPFPLPFLPFSRSFFLLTRLHAHACAQVKVD